MLCLVRGEGDRLIIGPLPPEAVGKKIEVMVAGVRKDRKVRLGIDADICIPILRPEAHVKVRKEPTDAAP